MFILPQKVYYLTQQQEGLTPNKNMEKTERGLLCIAFYTELP